MSKDTEAKWTQHICRMPQALLDLIRQFFSLAFFSKWNSPNFKLSWHPALLLSPWRNISFSVLLCSVDCSTPHLVLEMFVFLPHATLSSSRVEGRLCIPMMLYTDRYLTCERVFDEWPVPSTALCSYESLVCDIISFPVICLLLSLSNWPPSLLDQPSSNHVISELENSQCRVNLQTPYDSINSYL